MSTSDIQLDKFLDSQIVGELDITRLIGESAEQSSGVSWKEPGYEGSIDYRIRQLSYSSNNLLHACPRRFELYKKRTTHRSDQSSQEDITFAFGHCLGEAIQLALQDCSLQEIIFKLFLAWKPDLFSVDEKRAKSFWQVIIALRKFMAARENGFLHEYELVYYNGKPACELSFCITFLDGFRYRGHVDAVLRNKETSKVIVLEVKSTSLNTVEPALYKNSAQAIGYSVVLDTLFPGLSDYDVLYLPYLTKLGEYRPLEFAKSLSQRAQWIQEILFDIEAITSYETVGIYPMRGESCYSFNRICEYFDSCTMSTEYLTKPCTAAMEDKTQYQINLSLLDLLNTQLENTAKE